MEDENIFVPRNIAGRLPNTLKIFEAEQKRLREEQTLSEQGWDFFFPQYKKIVRAAYKLFTYKIHCLKNNIHINNLNKRERDKLAKRLENEIKEGICLLEGTDKNMEWKEEYHELFRIAEKIFEVRIKGIKRKMKKLKST